MANPLFEIIRLLESKRIHFFMSHVGHGSIVIFATTVGKRIEISVNEEGAVDFSVFRGNEDVVSGQQALLAEIDSD